MQNSFLFLGNPLINKKNQKNLKMGIEIILALFWNFPFPIRRYCCALFFFVKDDGNFPINFLIKNGLQIEYTQWNPIVINYKCDYYRNHKCVKL